MRQRRSVIVCGLLAASGVVLCAGTVVAQSWSNAQLLNDPSEAGIDVKTARVVASKDGGFHSIYHSANRVRYRRYVAGTLGPIVNVFPGTNFIANGRIAEALNGDIHVVFEDWAGGGPEVRWYKSSNGGASFPYTQLLSSSGGTAKHPLIAAFGMGSSAEVVMSYLRSGSHNLMYARYNGTTWSAESGIGSNSQSEYDCFGMARSPLNGSIYRAYDPNQTSMCMRQYTGSWGSPITLNSGAWPVRQHMAINAAGQVMLVWDQDSRIKSQLYTPGSGPGPVIDICPGGYSGSCDVCWIPGSNDFYMVVAKPVGSNFHVVGRRWSGGGWLAEESVQNGLADTFIVDPSVSCGPTGEMYCAFEYWGSGKPQQYYTIKAAPPAGPRGTIAGTVRDQYGAGVADALVVVPNVGSTLSVAGGAYSLVVPVGTYTLSASKNNFDGDTRSNVVVSENQTVTVHFVITGRAPAAVSMFTVTPSAAANRLTWWNPSSGGFTGTMIRYKMTGYPTNPSDGILVVDQPGLPSERESFDHTGLTNGVLYYYTAFAYFEDASRYYAGGVNASGRPGASVDFDGDNDVDLTDFARFQLCFAGPNRPPALPAECEATDTDADGDTDLVDFVRFEACFNGPNRPPACL